MIELYLRFTENSGEYKRVSVDVSRFTVGRHSENHLCIVDSRLSRDHLRIERSDNIFLVTDLGSSNGSKLNGEQLIDPLQLRNGDLLDLGGVEIEIEIVSAYKSEAPKPAPISISPAAPSPAVSSSASSGGGGLPTSVYYIVPLIAVGILLVAGLILFAFSGRKTTADSRKVDTISDQDDDLPKNRKESKNDIEVSTAPGSIDNSKSVTVPSNTPDSNSLLPTPPNLSGSQKTEQKVKLLLRGIAQNDQRAILTGEQAQKVDAKAKQFTGSSGLAENINSARKNSTQISTIAKSKGMKPQLIAVAALAKLGNSRGDVLQTAQTMTEILSKLRVSIGDSLADDVLLMIAAYDQGVAGDFNRMPNVLQKVAADRNVSASSRKIRTIWFLQEKGIITAAEYEFALQFLAVGTIAQNPKDFGVNAEALSF